MVASFLNYKIVMKDPFTSTKQQFVKAQVFPEEP